ncbi:MAG: L,D-transpeptidase/peptidoglycan binding protein [Actinomycetota bacterium]|nr:L,D-transpeptidase/peptidoglycan binding protein [Actinomycetota bacterium]
MKLRWSIVLSAAVVLVLGGGAGALYAYDATRSKTIANGVVVAGVRVGGLGPHAARQKLALWLTPRMQRPVTVRYARTTLVVTPASLKFRLNLDAMVNEALSVSRSGSFVGRAFRDLSGDQLHKRLPARVTFSNPAIWALARSVRKKVDRPAADAYVTATGNSVVAHPPAPGVTVRWRFLAFELARQLGNPAAPHVINVPVLQSRPKVTIERLKHKYPWYITVERGAFQLRLWQNLHLIRTYRIAVGQVGLETPAGVYHVQNKAIDPAWHVPNSPWAGKLAGKVIPGGTAENPLKARWLGIYNGAGIHGTESTWSLGSAASHGCIRMAIPDVIELYDFVPVQTPVYIG